MKMKILKLTTLIICISFISSMSWALIATDSLTETGVTNPTITTTTITLSPSVNGTTPIDTPAPLRPPLLASPNEHRYKVKVGENLSSIFSKLNYSSKDLHHIIHANKTGRQFAAISPGNTLTFKTTSEGNLSELHYQKSPTRAIIAQRINDTFQVNTVNEEITREINYIHTSIQTSLFIDAKKSGLSDKLIMELANIFAWDIDFALNLRKGDQFSLLFEKLHVKGKAIGSGNILTAEFINRGKSYQAVRYEESNGSASYYQPNGKSLKKAFLRTPIDFARVSSHFNLKRKHPVLNRIRAHKGVDYAASTGTRIKSTGRGKIIYRGRKGGYGRTVIVQHGQKYTTLYAHLSKYHRNQKVGSRVKQGDIIGYVGKSGLATGPHLHYEFRINGVHRNPLTVKLPSSKPIDKSKTADFKGQTSPLLAQLMHAKNSSFAENSF
jgi:murein DD-endopeptidase MepM/ murein hydrolase activator NlpD